MRAFKKFDPAAYREKRLSPPAPAKPAKVAKPAPPAPAKPAKPAPHFSNFSSFSRDSSPTRDSWSPTDWRAYFEERAAIREYDSGFARSEAERLAFADTVACWLSAHPVPASPYERCVHCGGGHRNYDELLPVLASGGHVWVHNACWTEWYGLRRQEAAAALNRIGLVLPASGGDKP